MSVPTTYNAARSNIRSVSKLILASSLFAIMPFQLANAGEPGAYIGLSLGASNYKEDSFNDTCKNTGISCGIDNTDLGFQVFGGYQFNPYISLEGGWVTYGEIGAELDSDSAGALLAKAEGLSITILPELPLAKHFSLYGRLGVVFADTSIELGESISGNTGGIKETSNATGFNYGIGGMLHFGRWDIRLEASQTDFNKSVSINSSEIDVPKVNLISLGVVFRFPKK